jgi:hypothetical protein
MNLPQAVRSSKHPECNDVPHFSEFHSGMGAVHVEFLLSGYEVGASQCAVVHVSSNIRCQNETGDLQICRYETQLY